MQTETSKNSAIKKSTRHISDSNRSFIPTPKRRDHSIGTSIEKSDSSPQKEENRDNWDKNWSTKDQETTAYENWGPETYTGNNTWEEPENATATEQLQPELRPAKISAKMKRKTLPPSLTLNLKNHRIQNEFKKLNLEKKENISCWYCEINDINDLIKCLDCEATGFTRYFCNTGNTKSHIISHMNSTNHHYMARHKDGIEDIMQCALYEKAYKNTCRNLFVMLYSNREQKFYCREHLINEKMELFGNQDEPLSVVTSFFLCNNICEGGPLTVPTKTTDLKIAAYEKHLLDPKRKTKNLTPFPYFTKPKVDEVIVKKQFTNFKDHAEYYGDVIKKEMDVVLWRFSAHNIQIVPKIDQTLDGVFFTFEDERLDWIDFKMNESLICNFYNKYTNRNAKFIQIEKNKYKAKLTKPGFIADGQMTRKWFITFKPELGTFKRIKKTLKMFESIDCDENFSPCHIAIQKLIKDFKLIKDVELLAADNTKVPLNCYNKCLELKNWNDRQKKAIQNAQEFVVSVCKGPPGSGKSDVAAALINMFAKSENHKRVLVCAASNEAVEVLLAKSMALGLRKYEAVRINSNTYASKTKNLNPFSLKNLVKDFPNDHKEYHDQICQKFLQQYKEEFEEPHEQRKQEREERLRAKGKEPLPRNSSKEAEEEVKLEEEEEEDEDDELVQNEKTKNSSNELDPRLVKVLKHQILKDSKVIFTTLQMSEYWMLNSTNYDFTFDVVILDECSQMSEPENLLALKKGCKKLIMFGDNVQIPPTVFCDSVRKALELTLLSKFTSLDAETIIWLVEQYRLDSSLTNLNMHMTYEKFMIEREPEVKSIAKDIFPWFPSERESFVWLNITTTEETASYTGKSFTNYAEVDVVKKAVDLLIQQHNDKYQVAVLTPYQGQADLLQEAIGNVCNVEVNTIDGFQGREADVAIVSFVRSNPYFKIGFLQDQRRLNVVLSRAKSALVLVGDLDCLKEFGKHKKSPNVTCWQKLAKYFKERNCILENHKVDKMLQDFD